MRALPNTSQWSFLFCNVLVFSLFMRLLNMLQHESTKQNWTDVTYNPSEEHSLLIRSHIITQICRNRTSRHAFRLYSQSDKKNPLWVQPLTSSVHRCAAISGKHGVSARFGLTIISVWQFGRWEWKHSALKLKITCTAIQQNKKKCSKYTIILSRAKAA